MFNRFLEMCRATEPQWVGCIAYTGVGTILIVGGFLLCVYLTILTKGMALVAIPIVVLVCLVYVLTYNRYLGGDDEHEH